MRKSIRERLEADYARVSRERVKRRLLDELAKRYGFEVPQSLVEQEFGQIWAPGRARAAGGRQDLRRREHHRGGGARGISGIAERRVRLGLVLAEVGRHAEVQISDEEMTRALIERARAFPGQEKEVWDFYRNNPNALAELRAPIFEEKAVDHILGLAKIEDRKMSPEELLKPEEDEKPAGAAAETAPSA